MLKQVFAIIAEVVIAVVALVFTSACGFLAVLSAVALSADVMTGKGISQYGVLGVICLIIFAMVTVAMLILYAKLNR